MNAKLVNLLDCKLVIEAIAAFPDENPLNEFLRAAGVKFNELEPPYLKMAKAANVVLKPSGGLGDLVSA